MSIIRIPEAVTNITHNTLLANKNAEVTDLETHVIVCSMRYSELESRIQRLEAKVDDMIFQAAATNKLLVRTLLAIAGSVVASLIVTHFKIM